MSSNSDAVESLEHDDTAAAAPPADSNIDHNASIKYWNDTPATADGMLGGFPSCSRVDLQGSKAFLAKARRLIPACPSSGKLKRGADCGAGIGRITQGFLSQICEVVDVVEPVEKFTQVLGDGPLAEKGVVGDIYNVGLENWNPDKEYDLIWTQWCVGHLTDSQLVQYIARCRDALTEIGIMVVKENNSTDLDGNDVYDDLDSSVTRTDEKFREIFKQAGMNLISAGLQSGFPKDLLPVRSYALRPAK